MLGQQEWIAIQNAPVQAQASFAVNTIYSSDKMSSEVYLCKDKVFILQLTFIF
ncbi:hypothetical protein SAMN05216463_1454 [Xylanibacter ruminicola]|uniref:Uncharacterized protein n=1 Tax=Xylanibacter ruminicola TaxID=839 RepID=A0A1M6Z9Q8_XYLRU|nr:hypothetical protein SAMN05216463_1454 [Xylanibacter ruminicola]